MKPYSLMDQDERERWADDHGYIQYCCPGCHRLFYSDSGPEGNCPCGHTTKDDDQ